MTRWFKKNTFVVLGYSFLALLAFRSLLLNNPILGHNWDWSLPGLGFLFNKLNILSNYTWWDFNLGLPLNLTISHLIPNTGLGFLSRLLGIRITILSLLVFIIAVSSLSFKKLLDVIIGETKTNYIPSFLYAFSPFLFNEIIGGSWYMWISYAFAPLLFVNLLKFIHTKRTKNLVGFLLSAIFVISSLQNFVLIEAIIILYLIYQVVLEREDLKKVASRYFFSHVVLVLFNLYWILTFVYSLPGFGQVISHPSFTGAFQSVQASTQDLLSILSLTGYLDRNMYYFALPDFMVPVFVFFVFLVWVLVILSIVLKRGISENKVNIWLLILLFMIIFIKGGNPPFSSLTMWLYNVFPLMKLYKSPQHLMFVAAFITPILIACSLNYLYKNLRYKKTILSIFGFCIFIWISGWWFNGDLGHEVLKNKQRDYIDFYTLSPGLQKVYERNEESSLNHRILFLPAVLSPQYLKTEYQNKAQGGQPEYMYLKNPTFTSESNPFANRIETILGKNMEFNYINYLRLFSVRDIVLRYDIYPLFTESAKYWDSNKVKEILDSSDKLNKFLEGKYEIGYSIKPEYFLPHFYVPQNIIYSNGGIETLPDIVSFVDYPIRSGIYLADSADNTDVNADNADEVFVKANLKNPVSEKELGEIAPELESVFFPYVRWKSGSLVYPLVLKKEELDEWGERDNPEQLFEKKLFYAAKRISEIEKWELALDENNWGKTVDRYEQKMEEVFQALEQIKQEEKKSFFSLLAKLDTSLQAHQERLENLRLSEERKAQFENIFEKLEEKLNQIKIKHDFSRLSYKFDIPKEGEYEVFIKKVEIEKLGNWEIDGEEMMMEEMKLREDGWMNLGKRSLKEGEHELILHLPEAENLTGKNWQQFSDLETEDEVLFFSPQSIFPGSTSVGFQEIRDYTPNTIFRLTFDYKAQNGKAGFSVVQDSDKDEEMGEINPLITKTLRRTRGEEFEHTEILIKSSPRASLAKLYLFAQPEEGKIADVAFKNVKVERVLEPTVILRSVKPQASNLRPQIPNITFAKINPTKYRVRVEGAKEPYTLVFSESFHKGWRLYVADKTDKNADNTEIVASYFDGEIKEGTHKNIFLDRNTFETWGKKPIAEDRHYLVNGYANSWYIKPEDVGGKENYEIIIEFWPQRLFYIGLWVSLATFLGCLGYWGYDFLKRKK